jgi:hypothetical protein
MTQDEIIEMARQADFEMDDSCVIGPQILWYVYQTQLESFAKLVAAKEREACAKQCEGINSLEDYYGERIELACAEAIRARGEQA